MENRDISILYQYNDYELADLLEIFLLKTKIEQLFSQPFVQNMNRKGNSLYNSQFLEQIKEILGLGFLNISKKKKIGEQKKNALNISKQIQKYNISNSLKKVYLKKSIKITNVDDEGIDLDELRIFSPYLFSKEEYLEMCNTRSNYIDVFGTKEKYDLEKNKYIFVYLSDLRDLKNPLYNLVNLLEVDIINVLQVSKKVGFKENIENEINPNYTNLLDLIKTINLSEIVFSDNHVIISIALALNKKVYAYTKETKNEYLTDSEEKMRDILSKMELLDRLNIPSSLIITDGVKENSFELDKILKERYEKIYKTNVFNLANVIRFENERKQKEKEEELKQIELEELQKSYKNGEMADNIIKADFNKID